MPGYLFLSFKTVLFYFNVNFTMCSHIKNPKNVPKENVTFQHKNICGYAHACVNCEKCTSGSRFLFIRECHNLKSKRGFFVGGNWKMNGSKQEIDKIVTILKKASLDSNAEVVVAVPSIYLAYVKTIVPCFIEVSGQNCYKVANGAFTGEISPTMLLDNGIKWVILGHSERRQLFKENDELIAKKVAHAIETGLQVIFCVGETLEEREAGKTKEVVFRQMKAVADKVKLWKHTVVAYEPVWAIGTGKTATPQQAQDIHKKIRHWITEHVNSCVAETIRIIYGGSVNAGNSKDLAKEEDIDGFLVGAASPKIEVELKFISLGSTTLPSFWRTKYTF